MERLGQTLWKKNLAVLQIITALLFILALLTINFTPYTGYSYQHCEIFDWRNLLQTANAHGLLRASSPDDTRIADLENVRDMLAQYFDIHGSYPALVGNNYVQNWNSLDLILSEANRDYFPHDPCSHRNSVYQYVYISTGTGDEYVLGALLSDTDYRFVSASHSDVDGLILGLWCGEGQFDREYCITSSFPHTH